MTIVADERNRSEAQNRSIDEWLYRISSGQLRLPSFQRGLAWDRNRVGSMLLTIVQDLPLGITLTLDVGDDEKFHSRPLESAPDTNAKVTEHLLDGQQRLTALWRALKDNSETTYFAWIPELDENPDNDDEEIAIRAVPRWDDSRGRKPLWADEPEECRKRGLVPVRLLDPSHPGVDKWVEAAYSTPEVDESDSAEEQVQALRAEREIGSQRRHLKDNVIAPLRERLKHYNLPYLRLPAATAKEVALRVFINMNTNAKPLRPYDIVVAELENATGHRLREMLEQLNAQQPRLRRYFDNVGDAVLQTSALMQRKQPNQRGYFELDHAKFVGNWEQMTEGLARLLDLLSEENLFDSQRVPSGPPLPVAAALLAEADVNGDGRAMADRLVRSYLWSAFFTTRYQGAAATRASADFAPLSALLNGVGKREAVPVFDRAQYPLPTVAEIMVAGWPKTVDRLGRAILAACNYFGARDFADDTKLSAENVSKREYHHIFPDALLREAGIDSYFALNCALITWKTNRTIGRLDPIQYLEDRTERAPDPRDVRERLSTHLVPFDSIANAGPYSADLTSAELAAAVGSDLDSFLAARAKLVVALASELCEGRQPQLRDHTDAA